MNDRDLEAKLRDRYLERAGQPLPLPMRELILAVAAQELARERVGRRAGPRWTRFRSTLLLAAMLVLTGTAATWVGSTPLPRPSPVPADRGVFTPTGSMAVARESPTATLLADGRVLVAGGYGGVTDSPGSYPSGTDSLASAEVWDPATGTFSPGGSLITARQGHTATLLRDGRVLISGGADGNGALAEAEIWDPATMTSSATGSLVAARFGATAMLLADGRVLVFGGTKGAADGREVPVTSAEVWSPDTGSFGPADSPAEASYPAGTLLVDGRVLVIDGTDASATVWDPTTRSSTAAGSLASVTEARDGLITTLLQDGRVLVAGGNRGPTPHLFASAEIWDPGTLTFDATGSLTQARTSSGAAVVLLRDGRVLIVGDSLGGDGSSAEVFELK